MFAISLLAGALSISPLNSNHERVENLRTEYEEITEEYQSRLEELETDEEKEDLIEEYLENAKDYSLKISRYSVYEQMISLSCIILYYGVCAYFMDGQTVGKKLMKIRVTNKEGNKASLIQLILRTLIIFEIPFKILTIILSFTCGKNAFYGAYSAIYYLTIVIDLILICTTIGRQDRRGLHDLIMGTKITIDGEEIKEAIAIEKKED